MASEETSEMTGQKLGRALKSKAILTERSKQLQQQVDDFRKREESMSHIATELLERQRELNYMLHRASSVLHQLQDTNLALSSEFTHIVKELPAPQEHAWDETVSRVNDLFKKTHELAGDLQEDILRSTHEIEFPRLQTERAPEPAPIPKVSEAQIVTSAPDAPAQVEDTPVAQEIHEAEISEVEESPVETQVESVEVEAPAEPAADDKNDDEHIDRLFARVDEMEFAESAQRNRGQDSEEQKPGFFAKLFARLNDDD